MARERAADALTSTQIAHGCCRGIAGERCNKRTLLHLPGRICSKCAKKVDDRLMAALAALDMEDDNDQ